MTRARPPPINTRTTRGLAIEMHLTVVAITIEPIPASVNPRPAKARPGLTPNRPPMRLTARWAIRSSICEQRAVSPGHGDIRFRTDPTLASIHHGMDEY